MAQVYSLIDQNGEVRLSAQIDPPPGTAPPTARGNFSGNNVNIADNAVAPLSWSDLSYPGGPVLDLTDPTLPVVLATGIYAVSVGVQGATLTAGGLFELTLRLYADGDDSDVNADSRPASAAQSSPTCFIANTYLIPAGGQIRLDCRSRDGASSRNFAIFQASVQRIT